MLRRERTEINFEIIFLSLGEISDQNFIKKFPNRQ